MFAVGALPEAPCKHPHLAEIGDLAISAFPDEATTCNRRCAQFCLDKIKAFEYAHCIHKYQKLFRLIDAANASKVNQLRLAMDDVASPKLINARQRVLA